MQSGHDKNWANEIEKKLVVLWTNAVVDVPTVVVEVIHAPIAAATVFRRGKHVSVANRAPIFKFPGFELLTTYEVSGPYPID